jgi:uracil-DNA glycosylase
VFSFQGLPLVPTLHPAALLYHPQNKRLVWEDMKLIAKLLGLTLQNVKNHDEKMPTAS